MHIIIISPANDGIHKIQAKVGNKTVKFGAVGYEDLTIHKDEKRKKAYIARHRTNEDWTRSGLDTPGYYAKWLLWNRPTLEESLVSMNIKYKDIEFALDVSIAR